MSYTTSGAGALNADQHARVRGMPPIARRILDALKQPGVTRGSMLASIWKLSRGDGRLRLNDYFNYGLYDPKMPFEEKAAFVSEAQHWPMTDLCSDMRWRAATEDKWLCGQVLERQGLPTPVTQAVVDESVREYGSTRRIRTAEEFSNFLATSARLPIFAKPNGSLGSFGAFLIESADNGEVQLAGGERVTVEGLFSEWMAGNAYLLQSRIENHGVIARFTPYVATVRAVNLVMAEGVVSPHFILKLPSRHNIADNFWRAGNMLADLDPDTGTIRRVVRSVEGHREEIDRDAETGEPIVGVTLPFWAELRKMNEACARLFAPVAYQSLDLALTPTGPCIVEVNVGGSFHLPQMATGKGFLTPQVREFFRSHGWKFKNG